LRVFRPKPPVAAWLDVEGDLVRDAPELLAKEHWPPTVYDFLPPSLGGQPWISKITVLLWIGAVLLSIGAAAVISFFLLAYGRFRSRTSRPMTLLRVGA
jgi:hypothetical protein